MALLAFGLDSWKTPSYAPVSKHQMLAGINQAIFVRQWGMPQATLTLSDLQIFFIEEFASLRSDRTETNNPIKGWIYEKKDALLVFRREKLVSHFRWSEFRERMKGQKAKVTSKDPAEATTPSWQQ